MKKLSGPVLRDTARLSQRYPPYCALWGFWCLNMANWARYPLPLSWAFSPPLGEHAKWRCDTPPPQKGYLSDTCAIPCENKANGCDTPLCDTISKRYCAISGVSRTGPPKKNTNNIFRDKFCAAPPRSEFVYVCVVFLLRPQYTPSALGMRS